MAINCINYGLPNRSPKLTKLKESTKKTVLSKCMLKSVELFNPDPMPYQKDTFKPCTVSRLVDIPRRINDSFMINDEIPIPRQRGIILHKDRYDWSSMKDILRNQNERLAAEENYIKKAKYFKNLSEQKLKSSNHNLILEGEPMLPTTNPEKNENKKEKYPLLYEENTSRRAAQSIVTNYNSVDDIFENIDSRRPVPMDVHKIKLNFRQYGGESINSAPVQSHGNSGNMESMQNMYLPLDGRDSFDRLPPINHKQKDLDPSVFNLTNNQNDFDIAYRQSERVNRPNIRLEEYILDAVPVKFNERADIQAELRCLKSMALPTTARDLYIGRGINLPSTHATKNPRGKYINSSPSYINYVSNNMKIETPEGGSVIINTETPPHKNSPMFSNQSFADKLKNEKNQLENIIDSNLSETIKFEEIFNSLSPDTAGLVDKRKLIDHINNIEELSENEKKYLEIVLHSVDKVTARQVTHILETIEVIRTLSSTLRERILQFDDQKMSSLQAQLPILLDQPMSSVKAFGFYESLIDSLNISSTAQYCEEIYKQFQEEIEFNESLDDGYIALNHILIFIPFLLQIIYKQ